MFEDGYSSVNFTFEYAQMINVAMIKAYRREDCDARTVTFRDSMAE